ncbi:hypothetical protein [Mycolicibacterium fluoranthenivorans]|uniref:VOC family protein n=1 Tax=Mycolicibacterium fluoranthenivorans TaxID=258505 RepID=A0A7X5U2D3_9MYCO|nr:hypothetical protein [Mycolicibacterium fluoranthenivorans]MCV7354325.1 hypothetical protein [Mycolicibacterium fluoranthenivorans]NIH97103.1 hypothetical protein [Mycolicibacterium fluoranthenivorans]
MTALVTPTLHLLTYRPEPMVTWWAALLGVEQPDPPRARVTTLSALTLTVLIERSDIALDYHREACGVTWIAVGLHDATASLTVTHRLAVIGSHPHRATLHPGYTRLWYLDPNGADVALDIAIDMAGATPAAATGDDPLFPDEVDPADVLAQLRERASR